MEKENNQTQNDKEQNPGEFKKVEKQPKTKNTFTKKYVMFILLLIVITGLAIYFTIRYMDNEPVEQEEKIETSENTIQEEVEVAKKTAEDAKFGIKSYTETYNENDLKIIYYADIDGTVSTYEKEYMAPSGQKEIKFVQINGLKNKNIQNKINARLKQEAYDLKTNSTEETISSHVSANFSNVLSLSITEYNRDTEDYKDTYINIDLTTGEDIPFEKVFVSSAPINSFLAEGVYEQLAWQEQAKRQDENADGGEWNLDMKNVDTSQYEDEFLKIANQYKKSKDNIKYILDTSGVIIYGLYKDNTQSGFRIKFINHLEEVAIYKRYLTSESIFENNNIGQKNIIVSTIPSASEEIYTILNYGKIKDNIFMEDVIEYWSESDKLKGIENVKKSLQKISDEQRNKLSVDSNKGMFYQRVMHIDSNEEKGYYVISTSESTTTCDISYFKDKAFKDFIHMKNRPVAAVTYWMFENYMSDDYPNLTITTNNYYEEKNEMYFSSSGEYLGTTEEEALSKLGKTDEIKNETKNNTSNNTNINTLNTI